MKKYIFIPFLLITLLAYADIRGKVTDNKGEPLAGINIYWLNTTSGTSTDHDGSFIIPPVSATNRLVFSSVAFQNDTIEVVASSMPLVVKLNDVLELGEVAVVQKRPGVVKPRFSVLQTERITTEELTKAACCNLSESFETNPSVDVSYSDAATGAKQIRLLGLPGTYVQMLTENIPNLRGISSVYGLGFIPGPWMDGISVSKGTGSVINGYEAITGQINVEYKKPQSSELLYYNLFLSDAGRIEMNANASVRLNPYLSTGILVHGSDEIRMLDSNNDGYMDMPKIQQRNLVNRWYYRKNDFVSQAFIRGLTENRMGGTMDGNYMIDIDTERYEFFLKNGYVIDPLLDRSVGLILSGSTHRQDAHYGLRHYGGRQNNLYLNFIYQTDLSEHQKISTGVSVNYDLFDEQLSQPANFSSQLYIDNYFSEELVSGVFAEYNLHLNEKFVMLAGLRADYHNRFGVFMTPRLHLKWMPVPFLNLRSTLGKGYRSPNMLAENSFYLASNRELIIHPDLPLESAWNYGLNAQAYIPLFNRDLTLTAEWYFTDFQNQVVIDVDTDPNAVHFYPLSGNSFAHSIQFEANMEVLKGLSVTLAHRINDVKTTIGGELREKPLINRYKGLATASYQTPLKKWQFDLTAQFNGGGRLPDPDKLAPLWEKDFSAFTIFNAQITRYFRTWSMYLGSENLTNFVQPNPIIDVHQPFSDKFDATNIWGPTYGRKFYVGMRWALEKS